MSYDLFFTTPPADSHEAFRSYFASRAHFEITDGQARYANEDTGVYFSFDLESSEDEDHDDDDEATHYWASFNLQFSRPHTFAREAAIEIEAFVSRFGRNVSDPQINGIGDAEFTVEGFLAGWSHGNAFARRTMAEQNYAAAGPTRPAEELDRIWLWNYARHRLQSTVGERVFVPRIGFFQYGGRICTGTVWGDGMPVVLPQTDIVVIARDELAPHRWFRRQRGPAVAEWPEVLAKLGNVRHDLAPLPHYFADHESTPNEVAEWIKSLPVAQGVHALPMDQVLDAEEAA